MLQTTKDEDLVSCERCAGRFMPNTMKVNYKERLLLCPTCTDVTSGRLVPKAELEKPKQQLKLRSLRQGTKFECNSCGYKFVGSSDWNLRDWRQKYGCPFCGNIGTVEYAKTTEDLIRESMSTADEPWRKSR